MARPTLIWLEGPGLEGLDPAALAQAAGLELDGGGQVSLAVASVPAGASPPQVTARLDGALVQWLDLAALVGAGEAAHRQARAIAALSGAAAALAQREVEALDLEPGPEPLDSVLVWGVGPAAVAVATQAANLGHPLLMASPTDIVGEDSPLDSAQAASTHASSLPPLVEAVLGASLASLSGAAGDFTATLQTPDGPIQRRFGAVVLAPAGKLRIAEPDLGLEAALPLLEMEAAAGRLTGDSWVAILAGINRPLSAPAFARALRAALKLQARPQTQVAFLFSEARVATEGGERLYRQARESGVLLMRVNPGELAVAEGGKLLRWPDALLGEDLELAPDLIGLAEEAVLDLPDAPTDLAPGQTWDDLTPEHARLAGGLTARHGLYVLGLEGDDPLEQAARVVGDLHERLTGGARALTAAVRRRDCAFCLTCLRACPHGALTWVGHKIIRRPAACQSCGICASLCPMGAIAPIEGTQAQLAAGLAAALQAAPAPRLVLLACRQSAMNAAADLARAGHVWPRGLVIVPVNCAGRVGEELVLAALARGAQGVLVAGCHEGNCRSLSGNLRSRAASLWTGGMLSGMGLASDRARFLNMAGNQPWALAGAVDEMETAASKEEQACA